MKDTRFDYELASWQALLRMLAYLVSRGYYYWHITYIPEKKLHKASDIDKRLIERYGARKSKFQRARQKKKGEANFYYMRWHNVVVMLHTVGEIKFEIEDEFFDIRKQPLEIKISELVSFVLRFRPKKGGSGNYTFYLSKDTYKKLKEDISHNAGLKQMNKLYGAFKRFNNFPSYYGILSQKMQLKTYLFKQAKKHGLRYNEDNFVIKNKINNKIKIWKEPINDEDS
ncbi:hypothetical protein BC30090_p405 (plasmid) [Bacillus cereus]|uniref:hypothetical protein n=1 Tax=Bacillus TaxID=1386 RepID=UPI0013D47776|nr:MULTISPECIES: hypothetical protein [Bacillus]NEL01370.1 hypothetical protein [Bacillus mobilis]BCD26932.1 hypothetical protein BC30090_p405 [Bacillus cereus]